MGMTPRSVHDQILLAPTTEMNAMDSDEAYDAAIAYAAERGRKDGQAAAAWFTFGALGGMERADTLGTAQYLLNGILDGDRSVLDTFPTTNLDGERVDGLTATGLLDEAADAIGAEKLSDYDDGMSYLPDMSDAYEAAFGEASSSEIERVSRLTIEALAGSVDAAGEAPDLNED
jgi:hypothetical protein